MPLHSLLPKRIFAICLFSISLQALANQEAHVHGIAELTVALEGNRLEMHLESPAANIVGFEHQVSTNKQHHAVKTAEKRLESPQKLFSFAGTNCSTQQVSVDLSAVTGLKEESHEHHTDEEHAHHDDHHGEKHDDHGHDEHDAHHEKTHSDIEARYHFACKQGEKLKSISVNLLDHFPGIEELHTQWITEAGQGAAELSAKSKVIHLK